VELATVVVAARRGDRRAFAELYQRFHRAVHGVVLARVRYADAADVVQDVFAAALERLPARGVRVQTLSTDAASESWLPLLGRPRPMVA
jgi:DNA-directed RNA polymerase specialized sigma24 family protein